MFWGVASGDWERGYVALDLLRNFVKVGTNYRMQVRFVPTNEMYPESSEKKSTSTSTETLVGEPEGLVFSIVTRDRYRHTTVDTTVLRYV